MLAIKFITWDEATGGIAVEHDGREVWSERAHDCWDQYFRHHMPRGVPVLLSQDTRPSGRKPDDRDYPRGEGTDARLKRWLVDNDTDLRIRDEDDTRVGDPVTMTGAALYFLLYQVAERMYWHGVDDVREQHGR